MYNRITEQLMYKSDTVFPKISLMFKKHIDTTQHSVIHYTSTIQSCESFQRGHDKDFFLLFECSLRFTYNVKKVFCTKKKNKCGKMIIFHPHSGPLSDTTCF